MSSARLDVWAQAQIVAYAKAGLRPKAIAGKVTKTDGKIPRLRSVQKTIAKTPDECAPASDGGNIGLYMLCCVLFSSEHSWQCHPRPRSPQKGGVKYTFC